MRYLKPCGSLSGPIVSFLGGKFKVFINMGRAEGSSLASSGEDFGFILYIYSCSLKSFYLT